MNRKFTLKEKIMFSLVIAGSQLAYIIVNSGFMKFFTDVIGLSGKMFGLGFLVYTIWNAVNDPLIGYWADKRKFIEGKGKYKHLIRWSIPLIGIGIIPIFFTPISWSEYSIVIYMIILMVIYEGAQTLLQVSFKGFKINAFLSQNERANVMMINQYVTMGPIFIGGMIPGIMLTGEFSREIIIAVFTGAIVFGLVLIFIGSYFVKEDKSFYENIEIAHGITEIFSLVKSLLKNKTFIYFVVSMFIVTIATGNYFAGYIYYMDNVLVVSGLKVLIPDVLTGVGQMIIFPFIVKLAKKYATKKVFAYGLLISVVGHFILTFSIGYYVAAVTYVFILVGYGFYSVLFEPLQGLIVDEIEIETGKRQPSLFAGLMQVLVVLAAGLQPIYIGLIIDYSGYVGSVKAQTPEVTQAIRYAVGLIPAILLLIGILVLLRLPIDKKREEEIQEFIENKHNQHV